MNQSNDLELIKKVLTSRVRVLSNYGFYGLLLMHMKLTLEDCETAYTDSEKIAFSRKFLSTLNNKEVDFILMHEIMHVALKHCFRGVDYNPDLFNIACDIVVNSNILKSCNMDLDSISVHGSCSMHQIDGIEGYKFSAEEVYERLIKKAKLINKNKDNNYQNNSLITTSGGFSDDHSNWNKLKDDKYQEDLVNQMIIDCISSLKKQSTNKSIGNIPLGVERIYNELVDSTVDWRALLADFLNFKPEYDYTFVPVDRRYQDYDFFMPDYQEVQEIQEDINIIFEVDTSGSIEDSDLTKAYSEIKGAIEQNSHMHGYLGFFDAKASNLHKFDDITDLLKIKPIGGGGTDLSDFFNKLDKFKKVIGKIDAIVIITDGELSFPKESARQNIPLIWLINNNRITPPWGIVARIK